jgi:hypothetical protein
MTEKGSGRDDTSGNEADLASYIDQINGIMDGVRDSFASSSASTGIPSTTSILLKGIASPAALEFLSSSKLDGAIDALFDKLLSGDYESVIRNSEALQALMQRAGIGEGSFQGPVSQNLQTAISNSMDSKSFAKTKSNIRKGYVVLWNMWKQGWKIKDRPTRKKYNDAVYAFKCVLKTASKVYSARKYVNDRMKRGVKNAINESDSPSL